MSRTRSATKLAQSGISVGKMANEHSYTAAKSHTLEKDNNIDGPDYDFNEDLTNQQSEEDDSIEEENVDNDVTENNEENEEYEDIDDAVPSTSQMQPENRQRSGKLNVSVHTLKKSKGTDAKSKASSELKQVQHLLLNAIKHLRK